MVFHGEFLLGLAEELVFDVAGVVIVAWWMIVAAAVCAEEVDAQPKNLVLWTWAVRIMHFLLHFLLLF